MHRYARAQSAVLALLTAAGCKFPPPADVPDDDDAGAEADASVDGRTRTQPLVTNHQPADLVIGQVDFATVDGGRPLGPKHLSYTHGLAVRDNRLWASDYGPDRVLLFQPPPTSNEPSGVLAVGAVDLFTPSPHDTTTAWNLDDPAGVADTGTKLLVVDRNRARVLIWNTIPTGGTQNADVVLGGQIGSFWLPTQVWSDGTRVVVADSGSHRVQIWRTFPTRNGQPPDLVLGQSSIDQAVDPVLPSARTLKNPVGIASDGHMLVVSDGDWNRLLVWRTFPDAINAPADFVIGQRDFETIGPGGSATALLQPTGLALVDGALFVADQGNSRVLVFDPMPTETISDASRASQVLGQATTSAVDRTQARSARTLSEPRAIAAGGEYLYVSDYLRTVRYRLDLP